MKCQVTVFHKMLVAYRTATTLSSYSTIYERLMKDCYLYFILYILTIPFYQVQQSM